jgi:hypothetical protein
MNVWPFKERGWLANDQLSPEQLASTNGLTQGTDPRSEVDRARQLPTPG